MKKNPLIRSFLALALCLCALIAGCIPCAAASSRSTRKATPQKIIYLTFDDGPGPYTTKLLQVLKKYNVKATFFVTNQFPKYQYCIKQEAAAGHTVGVHSYTHNYSTIYRSQKAYWNDYNRMNAVIYKQTGKYSHIMRFPGGSSNTVSRNYNRGIMTRLVRDTKTKGITYDDWNVSAGDADGARSSSAVYQNIIRGVQYQNRSIVLCHDIKPYTVNAIASVIQWGKNHGYTFKALAAGGYTYHHRVAN